jgi:predicted nucleic acid-binding protein
MVYLDSSALVKLVVVERESAALRRSQTYRTWPSSMQPSDSGFQPPTKR